MARRFWREGFDGRLWPRGRWHAANTHPARCRFRAARWWSIGHYWRKRFGQIDTGAGDRGPAARGTGRGSVNGAALPAKLEDRSLDQFRTVQLVFQNADTALNPAHSVRRILSRPLQHYHGLTGSAADRRVAELLDLTRLPQEMIDRPVTKLSGGQKQRVNLARALPPIQKCCCATR
jgi:energy-coupling factor transporter ATP-binding protein EcfA2